MGACAPGRVPGCWSGAVDYTRQLQSGGRLIATRQALQHMLANIEADIYQARTTSLVAQA
ncbi:acyl-CoA dehydrogenase family protein [Streptomyces sp. NEAU-NA10]|uniref:acyl-CoA dehydrogenase family protein n=1 Tax=Streptomyces sp. NEAU-NA10 TaxID=3416050 RepID=UPI003CC52714